MKSIKKIIFVITIVAFIIIVYLLLSAEDKQLSQVDLSKNIDNKISQNVAPTQEEMLFNYQKRMKEIFQNYLQIIQNSEIANDDLEQIKKNVLAVNNVPTAYKDLHINFIFAIDKMQKYLVSKEDVDKISSDDIIKTLKINYSWLNN